MHDEIFVVCFLQVTFSRLWKPIECYTNWYIMRYQKRYVLWETYLSGLIHHLLNGLSIIHFLVGLAIVRRSGCHLLSTRHVPHRAGSCFLHVLSCSLYAQYFCRSRVRYPDLVARFLHSSMVRSPDLTTQSF